MCFCLSDENGSLGQSVDLKSKLMFQVQTKTSRVNLKYILDIGSGVHTRQRSRERACSKPNLFEFSSSCTNFNKCCANIILCLSESTGHFMITLLFYKPLYRDRFIVISHKYYVNFFNAVLMVLLQFSNIFYTPQVALFLLYSYVIKVAEAVKRFQIIV